MLYITFITCTCFCLQKATLTNDTKDKEYTPHDLPQRQSVQPQETCSIARRAKRMRSEVSLISPAVLWHCHVSFILCMICCCLFWKLGVWVNVHILMQATHKRTQEWHHRRTADLNLYCDCGHIFHNSWCKSLFFISYWGFSEMCNCCSLFSDYHYDSNREAVLKPNLGKFVRIDTI